MADAFARMHRRLFARLGQEALLRGTPLRAGNRDYTYSRTLQPLPAPGSVRIDYTSGEEAQQLNDDGAGGITGDGTGTVDYASGALAVTLDALPDVDTHVVFSWASPTTLILEHGIAVTGEYGQVTGYRSFATIPAEDAPKVGDTLTVDGTGYVVDAIDANDGHTVSVVLR